MKLNELLSNTADGVLSLIYPPRCILCGLLTRFFKETLNQNSCLCMACVELFEPVDSPACPQCGLTMSPGELQAGLDTQSSSEIRRKSYSPRANRLDPELPHSHYCPHCTERPPAFVCSISYGSYRGGLRHAIHHLKYRDKPQLAVPLGQLLASRMQAEARTFRGLAFDGVVPVPIHPRRSRERGYNQAERIARSLCRTAGLTLERGLLTRVRHTRSQVGLSAKERAENLTGAFAVRSGKNTEGKTFLLIDDVTTTGSTLHECAQALKEAGSAAVYCLSLAAD